MFNATVTAFNKHWCNVQQQHLHKYTLRPNGRGRGRSPIVSTIQNKGSSSPKFLPHWVWWRHSYVEAIQCSLYMALGCYLSRKNSRLSISLSLSLLSNLSPQMSKPMYIFSVLCTAETCTVERNWPVLDGRKCAVENFRGGKKQGSDADVKVTRSYIRQQRFYKRKVREKWKK